MIVTCDECHTKYVVPGTSIGEDGRRVRCTQCGHEWFQDSGYDPDKDEYEHEHDDEVHDSFAEEMARYSGDDMDPIPDSIRPVPDGSSIPALNGGRAAAHRGQQALAARLTGYAAAALVFLCILGAIFAFHKPLVTIWPNTIVLFNMAGAATPIEGELLAFKDITAHVAEQGEAAAQLMIQGHIVNTDAQDSALPHLRLSLIEQGGNILDRWFISNAQSRIDGGADMPFTATYPDVPDNAVEVRLDLVPSFMAIDNSY